MDQVAKQSTVDRIAQASNILVTVSANPSVDQLAAAIGLTLFLNKQSKHATAVFSGDIPSTLEFLQPDKTIEKNTDSLRDFIVSLDKSKADKLRYKVEDKVVKIFITPYRTSISEKDLDFSQGDFNVDVVMALGVHTKEELDQAIVAHGRILHDATVISINNAVGGNLGTINWQDQQASSLCEMLVELAEIIKQDSFDAQMATSFLTGIVAETQRFSNAKTTSRTMSLSAKLMAAGANQQLVATQLQAKSSITKMKSSEPSKDGSNGTLEIEHDETPEPKAEEPKLNLPQPEEAPLAPPEPKSPIGDVRNEDKSTIPSDLYGSPNRPEPSVNPAFPAQAPSRGGTLTANTRPEPLGNNIDPLGQTRERPLMQRGRAGTRPDNNLGDKTIANIEDAVIDQDKTISDIEKSLDSDHVGQNPEERLKAAEKAVAEASPEPKQTARSDIAAQGRLEISNQPPAQTTSAPAMPGPTPSAPSVAPVTPAPAPMPTPMPPSPVSATPSPVAPPPAVPPPMPMNFPPQAPPAS